MNKFMGILKETIPIVFSFSIIEVGILNILIQRYSIDSLLVYSKTHYTHFFKYYLNWNNVIKKRSNNNGWFDFNQNKLFSHVLFP